MTRAVARGVSPPRPDDELLTRVRSALGTWEANGKGPTSSITGGGAIAQLERRLANLCGVRHAVTVASGTLGLRVAAAAVGVGPGSNVIVPALDWPAAAAAVRSLGAEPRPADSGAESLLMDPAAAAQLIDADTRAVLVTHVAGMPADLASLTRLCGERGVALIEDGSQALGATYAGRPIGGFGTAAAFSLGPGKLVDAGEGGVVVTNSDTVYAAALRASQHPLRQLRAGIGTVSPLALAARLHPVAALLALEELDALPVELAARRRLAETIRGMANGVPVVVGDEGPDQRFSWPCVPALVEGTAIPDLAATGLGVVPLGVDHIGNLVGRAAPTPNADRLMPLACGLYPLTLAEATP